MTGPQSAQGPEWGQGPQWGRDRERPEKESRPGPVQEWLRTITPIAALIFSVVALLVSSSTAVKVFVFPNPSPGASSATPAATAIRPSTSPGSSPKEGGTSVPSQAQLTGAMLPANTLGSAASTASPAASPASAGTKPAQLRSICGALFPKGAALATATETLINNQTNQTLTEIITYWASKNAAGNAISQDSNAIAKADSQACSIDLEGSTHDISDATTRSPPAECQPGQALRITVSTSDGEIGYLAETQCQNFTISVQILGNSTASSFVSGDTVEGGLGAAAGIVQGDFP
jgi:hypothetical protein